jgi:hypothetical protein
MTVPLLRASFVFMSSMSAQSGPLSTKRKLSDPQLRYDMMNGVFDSGKYFRHLLRHNRQLTPRKWTRIRKSRGEKADRRLSQPRLSSKEYSPILAKTSPTRQDDHRPHVERESCTGWARTQHAMVKNADCIMVGKQFPAGNESTTMKVIPPVPVSLW